MIYYSDSYIDDATSYKDYLAHHGVDHQRWGIRRGPPYPLYRGDGNKATYNFGKMTEKTKTIIKNTKNKVTGPITKYLHNKQKAKTNIHDQGEKKFVRSKRLISEMSDDELLSRIRRLNLERDYKRALAEANGTTFGQNSKVKAGKEVAKSFGSRFGEKIANTVIDTAGTVLGRKLIYASDMKNAGRKARAAEITAKAEGRKKYWESYWTEVGKYEGEGEVQNRKDWVTSKHSEGDGYHGKHDPRHHREDNYHGKHEGKG